MRLENQEGSDQGPISRVSLFEFYQENTDEQMNTEAGQRPKFFLEKEN